MSHFWKKYGSTIASLALTVGIISTYSGCRFFLHQPEVPEKLKEMAKKAR